MVLIKENYRKYFERTVINVRVVKKKNITDDTNCFEIKICKAKDAGHQW